MRLVTALFCLFSSSQGQTIEGLPALDQISFDKIVNKFEYSLIKFDVGYPTGDKHSAFGTLSKETAGFDNLFLGEVRVKDYGEKANQALAERFNVNHEKHNLPETILFTTKGGGGLREVVRYGGDYSLDNLRLFISSKTGHYIKCEGCIKELDSLAEKFALASSKEDRQKILFAAESWAKESEGGDVYLQIMKSALHTGKEGIIKEKERIGKMLVPCDVIHKEMANRRSVSAQHRKRKVASPALLLLQSQDPGPDLTCLIQSPDQVQDDRNFQSVAAQTEQSEKSTNLSVSVTSDTETFHSSRRRDSLLPATSILGSVWDRTEDWRKSSADTTHDISELELDTDIGEMCLEEEKKRRKGRRQCQCVLL